MSRTASPTSAPRRLRLPRVTRTDVVLSVLCAIGETVALGYVVHRKGWFRA